MSYGGMAFSFHMQSKHAHSASAFLSLLKQLVEISGSGC